MRQVRHRVSTVVAGMLLSITICGRVAAAAPRDAEPPRFGSEANVVLLDVVARDGKGRLVVDLRPEELRVRENGRDCRIASVRLVGLTPAEAPRTAPGGPEAPPAAAPAPLAAAVAPARATLVVLVFDRISTRSSEPARKAVLSLLSQKFPPDTWFAVFRIAGGTQLVQPFTADQRRLEHAVRLATLADDAQRRAEYVPLIPLSREQDELLATAGPPIDLPDLREVARGLSSIESVHLSGLADLDTIRTLKGIASALQPLRGRKAILYVAEPWHMAQAWTGGLMDDAVSAANRANVTIDTVNALGLTTEPSQVKYHPCATPLDENPRSIRQVTAHLNDGPESPTPLSWDAECIENTLMGPRPERLADDTGGVAITDTNDLSGRLAQLIEELGRYYEVVYEPPNPVQDGRFRRIRIETTRKGVRLKTRSGYYATPRGAPTLSAYELPLIAALATTTSPRDLPLESGLLQFGARGGERESVILTDVPLSAVQTDSHDSAWRARLTLLTQVKDEQGRVIARLTDDRPLAGRTQDLEVARRGYVTFTSRMLLPPGNYELETAAQDVVSGRVGVARAPFRVERLRKGLLLGSVAFVRSAAAAPADSPGDDPLRVGDVRLVPASSARFAAAGELTAFVSVYPVEGAEPVRLTVELSSQGRLVTQAAPSLPAPGSDGRITWLGGIPLSSLPPGQYELLVRARQGSSAVEDRARFELVAGAGS